MKLRRLVLALGAIFALAAGISGCGSGIPGDSVADVAGNPITLQAFNHWMYVAAKGNQAQTGSTNTPVIVPTDPPSFTGCIAQARKQLPQVARQSNAQLKTACGQLFTSLSGQVLDYLIRAYWYQADATRQHVKVTDAQVQQQFNTEKTRGYPTPAAFQAFLSQSGFTVADLMYRVRLQLIFKALVNKQIKPVTSADIAAYYASHQASFGTPETRDLRIVLTKTAAQASAAKAALASGQSWNAVAKKYSIDPATKNKGGVMTGVTQGSTDPALQRAAFSALPGRVEGPVRGQFGYYVVDVTKVVPATQKSLAQEASVIRQTLITGQQSAAQSVVDSVAKKRWMSQTKCRSAYAMADCAGYKAPKTPGAG